MSTYIIQTRMRSGVLKTSKLVTSKNREVALQLIASYCREKFIYKTRKGQNKLLNYCVLVVEGKKRTLLIDTNNSNHRALIKSLWTDARA